MSITTFLLLVWAVVGPIWAILFARKNPRISGWIAKEVKAQKDETLARAQVEIDELNARICRLTEMRRNGIDLKKADGK